MAFSVSPSVIVREVDLTNAVPAIATPPAAFAGVFRWGPINEPTLVSSENELAQIFGAPNNNNYETFFTAADYLAYSNALYVTRADNDANTATAQRAGDANTSTDFFEALHPGALGNSIDVSICTSDGFDTTVIDTQTANTLATFPFNSNNVTIDVDDADRIPVGSVTVGDVISIGNGSSGYQDLVVSTFSESAITEPDPANNQLTITTGYTYAFTFTKPYLGSESKLRDLELKRKWAHHATFGIAPSEGNMHVIVTDNDGGITGKAGTVLEVYDNLAVTTAANTGAVNANTSATDSQLSDGRTNYYRNIITSNSKYIALAGSEADAEDGDTNNTDATDLRIQQACVPVDADSITANYYESFSDGTDGDSEKTAKLSALAGAYDKYKAANEIDISAILVGKSANIGGGSTAADHSILANYLVSNIAEYRRDCVVYISPAKELAVDKSTAEAKKDGIIDFRNSVQNSSYWFMDSGYKYRYDKYNDVYRWVPMNGDMAGLASRVQVFESPAGFKRGLIKNVVKLAYNPTKAHRDALYSKDVNPVMSQVGQGIVLFGDKTGLGSPSAFDRINVRRLFIAVEKAIATAAETFLFDFNDEFSQTQFKNVVEPFLRDIQGRRGITDFRVVSDATVNTPEVIDQNKFRANIFIKPARTINVIELTFVATRTGVEFDEVVGALA